jgi:hypothetical protein
MAYRQDFTLPAELMKRVAEQGLEFLPELIRIVINACDASGTWRVFASRILPTNGRAPRPCQRVQT